MKERKKVLLITYYWPPSGGAGVHRWLRFSSYFDENDVDLTVYCPSDAAWPSLDEELKKQINPAIKEIRRPIFEPHKYLSGGAPGVGLSEKKKRSTIKKMMVWVRGNLFIPDSRAFWIKPSKRFLLKYLQDNPGYDAIISTGPPHSTHLIALGLKKKLGIKWIADFRDPWTQIDFYHELQIGKRADKIQHKLEKEVLDTADEIVTVSSSCATGLEEIAHKAVHIITNGYTFPEFTPPVIKGDDKFIIAHFGSMPSSRNPVFLWKTLAQLTKEHIPFADKLQIDLIGTVDISVVQSISDAGLDAYVQYHDPVSHSQSILRQRNTPLLLLIANTTGNVKGILTGKFFEYLGAKRPILATGQKDSDLEQAMLSTNAGFFATPEDTAGLKHYLLRAFEEFSKDELTGSANNLEQFSSRSLVTEFCKLI